MASGTLDDGERAYLDDEFEQLSDEVERIAQATEFNDLQLADGSQSSLRVRVGVTSGAESQVTINLGNLTVSNLSIDTVTIDLTQCVGGSVSIDTIDNAIDTVNSVRAGYGAVQNRIDSSIRNMVTYVESSAARARSWMRTTPMRRPR